MGELGGHLFFSGLTPCQNKESPPLCTILRYPFLVDGPITFFGPIILILRGERATKKRNFLVKFFLKVPQNEIFGIFFLAPGYDTDLNF